ncbi:MAG: hypothetical protein HY697_02080 [Deltaproteobacteria bacterium]|nr:hypothetical protein [Deltaproteobacteria bacterium]
MNRKRTKKEFHWEKEFPAVEELAREAEARRADWIQDPAPLLERLRALSGEEQETFLLCLLRRGDEEMAAVLLGREEGIDLALARSLGRFESPRSGPLLHRLAEGARSKPVVKAARKSIFRLRSLGLPIDEAADRSPAVYHPPRIPEAEGFLSAIDTSGHRLVFLMRPQAPQGGLVIQALISDEEGITDFSVRESSRKAFHEFLSHFREEYPWQIVEADPEYCRHLILDAGEIGQQQGKAPPPEYLAWRNSLGPPPALPFTPLIYRVMDMEEVRSRPDLLVRSPDLFKINPFQTWFLDQEEAPKYLALRREMEESPLVLSPHQKEGRLQEFYRQAVQELFDRSRRLRYRRRMEEMAYVLWKEEREDQARLSLATALDLEAEGGIVSGPQPFLFELVKRSLDWQEETDRAEKKERESQLVIKP